MQVRDLYFLLVIALLKVIGWSSSPRLKNVVVHSIAAAAYRLSRNKRRRCEENVTRTFCEDLGKQQRRRIVKRAFSEFWRDVFSLTLSRREKAALKAIELSGVEHLQAALNAGRGAILWESNSFGQRHLAKHLLYERGFSLHQVHSEGHLGGFWSEQHVATWVRRHIVKPFFERCEKSVIEKILYLPDSDSLVFTRRLRERLKQNAILCIAGDGGSGRKTIPQLLFGHTKLFATGMVSLAKISGAPILPMFCVQEADGKIRLIIKRPVRVETEVERVQGVESSVAEYVGLLESFIRRYPEQYRSWHYLDRFPQPREPTLEA